MSDAKKGKKHRIYGKIRPYIAGSPAQNIIVKNGLTNKSTTYTSISEAAAALGIKQSTFSSHLSRNEQTHIKGNLYLLKSSVFKCYLCLAYIKVKNCINKKKIYKYCNQRILRDKHARGLMLY